MSPCLINGKLLRKIIWEASIRFNPNPYKPRTSAKKGKSMLSKMLRNTNDVILKNGNKDTQNCIPFTQSDQNQNRVVAFLEMKNLLTKLAFFFAIELFKQL